MTTIETERGGTQWGVQVVTPDGFEHEMRISADGASLLRGPTKEDDDATDRAKHKARVKAAKLDYTAAAERLIAAVPSARIVELNLDDHRGKTVWEADLVGRRHKARGEDRRGLRRRRLQDHWRPRRRRLGRDAALS